MLGKLLGRFRFSVVDATAEGTPASSIPSSLLPADADEIRELNSVMRDAIREVLSHFELEPCEIEIRRRISTRQFRAYISLKTDATLTKLESVESIIRKAIHKALKIEISDVHWRKYGAGR